MTRQVRRRTSAKQVEHVEQLVRGLAAELLLQSELAALRTEIKALDDRCIFYESVYGTTSPIYREVASERDMLLLQADQLITQWTEKHVNIARVEA